ncbi:MAG: hypothetical protein Q6K70_09690, partial [Thermostichales cyanobacterium DRC_bins_46]
AQRHTKATDLDFRYYQPWKNRDLVISINFKTVSLMKNIYFSKVNQSANFASTCEYLISEGKSKYKKSINSLLFSL